MNRRFLTVLALSAALALVVSAVFYQMTVSSAASRRAQARTRQIVVAANPVALGATIRSPDLKMVGWPAENVPPGAYSKMDEVVDRVALSNMVVEEPVLEGRLATKGSGLGLAPMIPAGKRAVSVRVNDVISVAGFVFPGSRVDVLVTGVPRGAPTHSGPVTRTVLSNVPVLSSGKNIQPDGKGQPENVVVVTLLVTPEEAEVLTLASSEGKIQLALRNNTDDQTPTSPGALAVELFAGTLKRLEPPPAKPRPPSRLVTVRLPPSPAITPPPPPPPPPQIEMIRGDKRNTEILRLIR